MYANTKNISKRIVYLYQALVIMLAFLFALSGYWDISKNELTYPGTLRMGYPPYFILSLGVAKILGAVVLLIPNLKQLREWAFAGFTFDVIFAFISSLYIDSYADWLKAVIAFCLVLLTYSLFRIINQNV